MWSAGVLNPAEMVVRASQGTVPRPILSPRP